MSDSQSVDQIDRIAGSIAGAFVDAVRREGLLRSETPASNAATQRTPSTTPSNSTATPTTTPSLRPSSSTSTTFQRALELQASMRRECM